MTIKENILYGNPAASDEEVVQALKSANAWDFIQQKMVQYGIDTNVGNAGGQLSGGQKQRLAIARAFIKKPKILLLDEATSALDKKNEKEVQAAIDKIKLELGGSITTIVIAHRLSTIRDADKIIVMSKGKIKEVGNHQTLLKDYPDGIYAKFVHEQEVSEDPKNDQHANESEGEHHNDNSAVHISNEEEAERRLSMIESRRKSTFASGKRNKELERIEEEMRKKADKVEYDYE